MLGRHTGITRPTVLFAVWAIGREIHKVCKIAGTRIALQEVCDTVGAGEVAALGNIAVLHKHGDGFIRDLLFFRADNKEIARAMVSERRNVFLHALAFADVNISLTKAERIEHLNIIKANAAVRVAVFRRL